MTYKEEQQINQGRPIFGLGCCLKKLGKKSSQKGIVSVSEKEKEQKEKLKSLYTINNALSHS